MFQRGKGVGGTHDRTNSGAEERCGGEDGHSKSTLLGGEEIRDGTTKMKRSIVSSVLNKSLQTSYTNPALVRGLDPAVPAKNLKMMSVQMFWEAMTAPLKMVNKM